MEFFSKKTCLLTAAIALAVAGCDWDDNHKKTASSDVAPVADAGVDLTFDEGKSIGLAGVGRTVKGAPAVNSYAWRQVSGVPVSLSDTKSPTLNFTTPQVSKNEPLVFELTVDNGKHKSSDQVTISITNIPTPPKAKPSAVRAVFEGESVTLQGEGEPVPNKPAISQYRWTQVAGPSVTLTGANSKQASFTAPAVAANTELTFSLVVTSDEPSEPSLVTLQVLNKSAVAAAGAPIRVREGEPFELDGSASKPRDRKSVV